MRKEKLHIAVCPDKDYVMPTGVMMYSVCVNNQDVDIDFHIILDDSVTMEEQQDLNDTISMFDGKKVIFYHFNNMSKISFPIISWTHLTRAAYYRLFLSSILPTVIDKVLYLDGDLIVRHSLLPLWQTDLTGYAVGATIDASEGDIEFYNRLRYSHEKGYFNSGVLLINLKYWRDNHVEKVFVEYIKKAPERILYADQDVMNVVFQDKKLIIPVKYNFQTAFLKKVPTWDYWKYEKEFKDGLKAPVILHFTTSNKPWIAHSYDPHPYSSSFFKYQSMTRWNNHRVELRSTLQIIRNYAGDFLRTIKVKAPLHSKYINVPPID